MTARCLTAGRPCDLLDIAWPERSPLTPKDKRAGVRFRSGILAFTGALLDGVNPPFGADEAPHSPSAKGLKNEEANLAKIAIGGPPTPLPPTSAGR